MNSKNNGLALLLKAYATETVSCRLLLPMAGSEMDWNWKKLGQFFQVLMLCVQKSPKNYHG